MGRQRFDSGRTPDAKQPAVASKDVSQHASIEDESQDYGASLEARVREVCAGGIGSIFELCRECLGAFPPHVMGIATRLGYDLPVRRSDHWSDDEGPGDLAGLTEPHPLDFEWRFTNRTAQFLADWIGAYVVRGEITACFGTPTLFTRLIRDERSAYLFDRNPSFGSLRVRDFARTHVTSVIRTIDLLESDVPIDLEPVAAVVLDPPWYVEHTLRWIRRALGCVKPEGFILTTVFPGLLRPRARDERRQLFEVFARIGQVTRVAPDAAYSTPLFERETLAAVGLADLGAWRTGEVYAIRVDNPHIDVPDVEVAEDRWHRVKLGTQVIALRGVDADANGTLTIRPGGPYASFLLKSVSSKDPARREINLLTSRNRAALTSHPTRVKDFLELLASGVNPASAMDRSGPNDRPALQTVLALVGW